MKRAFIAFLLVISSILLTACNPLSNKMKSGLQVMTNDIPASLFFNGQYLEKTPFIDKNIQPGQYNLRIEPDDPELTPHEMVIDLNKGLLTVVTWKPGKTAETSGGVSYELEPVKSGKKSEVSFVTIPDSAFVQFDTQEKQFSPLILSGLEPGHHEFEVSLPSYETQKHTINLVAGHRLNISVKLAKSVDANTNVTPTPTEKTKTIDEAAPSLDELTNKVDNKDQESTASADNSEGEVAGDATGGSEFASGTKVKIKSTDYFQNSVEVLRVRDKPSTGGGELGFAKVGQEYPYLNEQASGWYKINFEGQEGWVSIKYAELVEE